MENYHKIMLKLEGIEQLLLKNSQVPILEYYDSEQAARYLRISKSTLYKYISDEQIIAGSPAGKLIRIPKSELDRFLSSNNRRGGDDSQSQG